MPSGIDTLSLIFPYGQIEGKEDEVIAQIRKAVAPDHIELEKGIAILAVVDEETVPVVLPQEFSLQWHTQG